MKSSAIVHSKLSQEAVGFIVLAVEGDGVNRRGRDSSLLRVQTGYFGKDL